MARIRAFRGVRYNQAKIADMAGVIAPPYDVISPEMQKSLYQNDHNIVHIDLGMDRPEDTDSSNKYTRASETFKNWLKDGTFVRDDAPAIYLYAQDYTALGEQKTRIGVIVRLRLAEFGTNVFPHEHTLTGPKKDRLELMRHTHSNLSQVFGLYTDEAMRVESAVKNYLAHPPLYDIKDKIGDRHRFWAITDDAALEKISAAIEDKDIFIADGHHRYETAIAYRNERREQAGPQADPDAGYEFVSMFLTNTKSAGLTILPTHRVVKNVPNFKRTAVIRDLASDFLIHEFPFHNDTEKAEAMEKMFSAMASAKGSDRILGMYLGGSEFRTLQFMNENQSSAATIAQRVIAELDVTILHDYILSRRFGIGIKEAADKSFLSYVVDRKDAAGLVDAGTGQAAFFLNPTKIEQVKDVASTGGKMPQKSTYFYPKLVTGLVINPLD